MVAVDGPSGSGKSTVSRRLAAALGARYLDTGAMYRAVTWAVLQAGVDPTDAEAVAKVAGDARLASGTDPAHPTIELDGVPIDVEIRGPEVTAAVSAVAAVPAVRRHLVAQQQGGELGSREAPARTIDEHDGVRLYAPWASALPYQLRAAPVTHASDAFAATGALASALTRIAGIYRRALGDVPWNAWLYTRPLDADEPGLHWHVEAFPRMTVLASIELGAGLPICTIEPEAAARALRGE